MAGQPRDKMLPEGFSMRESAFDKWARKPETKAKLAAVKKSAWPEKFTKQFPIADKNQFFAQISVDEKYHVTAEVFLNEDSGSSVSVFGSDRKYWSQKMKTALGLIGTAGFPFQLSPLKTKTPLPIRLQLILQKRRQVLQKSLTKRTESMPRHTNFS